MPGMDGLDVATRARKYYAHSELKIILLSSGWEDTADKWQKAGIDRRLSKPVRRSELLDMLLILMGRETVVPQGNNKARNTPVSTKGQRLSVLVAEDNPVNRELATLALNSFGHDITVAQTGCEAVELWERGTFDLILMDIQMPEMDGLMATRNIREKEKQGEHIPIIALTAHAMPEDREKCIKAGMDAYIAKPIDIDLLGEKIAMLSNSISPKTSLRSEDEKTTQTRLYDLSDVKAMLKNDSAKIKKFINLFIISVDENFSQLAEAIESNDSEKIRLLAHTIKGSAAQVGAEKMKQLSMELEEMGRENKLDNAQKTMAPLKKAYSDVKSMIEEDK